MIPIYLCDDELPMRQHLSREIEQAVLVEAHDMRLVCSASSPEELLAAMGPAPGRGIYFLDVDLNASRDGFALAQEIRARDPRGFIVFVTSHGERAFDTFRHGVEALDYIEKQRIGELPARIRTALSRVAERLLQENIEASELYTVKVFDEVHHVPVKQLLYFETSSQKHRLVLHADHTILEFFGNLQTISEHVGAGFWRVHRSYLVNRDRVRTVHLKENEVELDNGERCPLSRKAKKDMPEPFGN